MPSLRGNSTACRREMAHSRHPSTHFTTVHNRWEPRVREDTAETKGTKERRFRTTVSFSIDPIEPEDLPYDGFNRFPNRNRIWIEKPQNHPETPLPYGTDGDEGTWRYRSQRPEISIDVSIPPIDPPTAGCLRLLPRRALFPSPFLPGFPPQLSLHAAVACRGEGSLLRSRPTDESDVFGGLASTKHARAAHSRRIVCDLAAEGSRRSLQASSGTLGSPPTPC